MGVRSAVDGLSLGRLSALVVAGSVASLAPTTAFAAALAWAFLLSRLDVLGVWPALVSMVLVYDLALVGLLPATRPGLLAVVRGSDQPQGVIASVRTVSAEASQSYGSSVRATLRGRIGALGLGLLVAPIVVALALVVGTTISFGLYAAGLLKSPHPYLFLLIVLGVVLLVRAVSLGLVGLSRPFAIDGAPPTRAWRESVRRHLERPRGAAIGLAGRVILGTLPFVAGIAVMIALPSEDPAGLGPPLVAVFLVGAVTKPVEAWVVVRQYSGHEADEHPSAEQSGSAGLLGIVPRPSRRTALVILLVAGLAVASAGVRVADVRPGPEPAAPAELDDPTSAAPIDLYSVALDRTIASSRTASMTAVGRNLTTGEREGGLRSRVTIDYAAREIGARSWTGDGSKWERLPRTYVSDGLYRFGGWGSRPQHVFWEGKANGVPVYAAPQFADLDRGPYVWLPERGAEWTRERVGARTIVLRIDDPEEVRVAGAAARSDRVRYLSGSYVRATIDRETQRLVRVEQLERRVRYADDDMETVDDRGIMETTITYDYENVSVQGPSTVRLRLAAIPWDLLYY